MDDKIKVITIINNFFRGKAMDTPVLKVLQENYNKELQESMSQPGGCSKCKKNSIRRQKNRRRHRRRAPPTPTSKKTIPIQPAQKSLNKETASRQRFM